MTTRVVLPRLDEETERYAHSERKTTTQRPFFLARSGNAWRTRTPLFPRYAPTLTSRDTDDAMTRREPHDADDVLWSFIKRGFTVHYAGGSTTPSVIVLSYA
jgi:hypothetical protein